MPQVVKGLQSFPGGMPQRLLDHYQKWQVHDPVELLKGLWKELKRHFARVTVISNSLLERLWNRAILVSKNMIICYSSQVFARILRVKPLIFLDLGTSITQMLFNQLPRSYCSLSAPNGRKNCLLFKQQWQSVYPFLKILYNSSGARKDQQQSCSWFNITYALEKNKVRQKHHDQMKNRAQLKLDAEEEASKSLEQHKDVDWSSNKKKVHLRRLKKVQCFNTPELFPFDNSLRIHYCMLSLSWELLKYTWFKIELRAIIGYL